MNEPFRLITSDDSGFSQYFNSTEADCLSRIIYCFPKPFLKCVQLTILVDIMFDDAPKFLDGLHIWKNADHFIKVSPLNPNKEWTSLVYLASYGGNLYCIKKTLWSSDDERSSRHSVRITLIKLQHAIASIFTHIKRISYPVSHNSNPKHDSSNSPCCQRKYTWVGL